jgi:uncharacterized spore protein YtfJ
MSQDQAVSQAVAHFNQASAELLELQSSIKKYDQSSSALREVRGVLNDISEVLAGTSEQIVKVFENASITQLDSETMTRELQMLVSQIPDIIERIEHSDMHQHADKLVHQFSPIRAELAQFKEQISGFEGFFKGLCGQLLEQFNLLNTTVLQLEQKNQRDIDALHTSIGRMTAQQEKVEMLIIQQGALLSRLMDSVQQQNLLLKDLGHASRDVVEKSSSQHVQVMKQFTKADEFYKEHGPLIGIAARKRGLFF